jgi:hypothetical protein
VSPPYHHEATIRADLGATAFQRVNIERVTQPASAASAREAAIATVHGSLIRTAIEAADAARLDEATDAVEWALVARFGKAPIDGATKALIVTGQNPEA